MGSLQESRLVKIRHQMNRNKLYNISAGQKAKSLGGDYTGNLGSSLLTIIGINLGMP